jgi:hypothetical protein
MRFLAFLAAIVFAMPAMAMKSAKKMKADSVAMVAPEVVESNDNLLGLRTTQGSAFDGATVIGLNYEHMMTDNFGLGGNLNYAEYDRTVGFQGMSAKYDYKVWTLAATGNFHVNIFKVKNMDTFFTGGVARSRIRGEAQAGGIRGFDTSDDETKVIAYANLRYFVNSQMGFTVMMGTGLGNFGLGFDALF